MAAAMSRDPPGLDDPRHAAFAWARFRRILWAIAAFALICAIATAGYVWLISGPLPLVFLALTVAGVWVTIMMAGLLMGLMFLSSGTGHDGKIEDRVGQDIRDMLDADEQA